jgi:hypothetical protein
MCFNGLPFSVSTPKKKQSGANAPASAPYWPAVCPTLPSGELGYAPTGI